MRRASTTVWSDTEFSTAAGVGKKPLVFLIRRRLSQNRRTLKAVPYLAGFCPVFGSRKIGSAGLLRLKSNMLHSDPAIASADPLPSRLPPSQRSSIYLITDDWSVTL